MTTTNHDDPGCTCASVEELLLSRRSDLGVHAVEHPSGAWEIALRLDITCPEHALETADDYAADLGRLLGIKLPVRSLSCADRGDVPRAEYDRVLDRLRYVAAEAIELLRWRATRVQAAIKRDDVHPELVDVVVEEMAELRDMLQRGVAACTDYPGMYSDGRPVVTVESPTGEDWEMRLLVEQPPA